MYRRMYYGPLRCASLFRIDAYLLSPAGGKPIACESLRLVYYAIPKTGCTTVKSLLLEAEGHAVPDDDEMIHSYYEKNEPNASAPRFRDYFRFTFVRNPWDRLVSCYCNKVLEMRPGNFHSFNFLYNLNFAQMSFADFVRFVCRVPDDLSEPHFRLQSNFFGLGEVDFVGRFERFPDDLAQVIERAGLGDKARKWCDRQQMRSTRSGHYADYYNAKTRRLVAARFRDDIERFDYRFDG